MPGSTSGTGQPCRLGLGALQGGLAALNSHLEQPIPMNRFRPNLVVDDQTHWAEDTWEGIRLRGANGQPQAPHAPTIDLRLAAPASRCSVRKATPPPPPPGGAPKLGSRRRQKPANCSGAQSSSCYKEAVQDSKLPAALVTRSPNVCDTR